MKQALGLVEIQGLSTAITVADTMVKAANVRILELENTRGLGYMTIKITGDVGAVNAAVNTGRQVGTANQKLVSWKVIPRPTDYVEHTFCNPASPKPDAPDAPAKKTAVKKSEKEYGPADLEAPSKQQSQTAPEGAKTAPAHKKSGTSKSKK